MTPLARIKAFKPRSPVYGSKPIPNRLSTTAATATHPMVRAHPAANESQKFTPRCIIHGIRRNIGIVGSTYQNV